MDEKTVQRDRFNWRLSIYAGVSALILFVPIMIFSNDVAEFLYIVIGAPTITFLLLIFALNAAILKKRLRSLAVLSMIAVYCAVSWGLFIDSRELHPITRWLLWSKHYKAQVLAQPDAGNGMMKHIEWDAWGFAGAGNTTVYLVYDPDDYLSTAAKTHSSGKFRGLPCEVARVRGMERQYYAVLFYTGTDWSHCN